MEDFWYGMEMEWKKIASMEYGKIVFHSISYHALTGSGYHEHTNPLFYRAKCLKLKHIYSLETAKLMYKIRNNVLSLLSFAKSLT